MPHVREETDAAPLTLAGAAPSVRVHVATAPAVFVLRSRYTAPAPASFAVTPLDPALALAAPLSTLTISPEDPSWRVRLATSPAVFRLRAEPAHRPYGGRVGLTLGLSL